jgi:Ca2+-transporting ATPase
MILTDDNFATIVKAVELGRALYDNLVRYIRFQMACLFGFIATFLGASILWIAEGTPFLPLQTLYINFTVQVFLAVGLGFGKAREGLMDDAPRSPKVPILSRKLSVWLVVAGISMAAATLGVIAWATPIYGEASARTMGLVAFSLANIWFALETTNEKRSVFSSETLQNPTLLKAAFGSLVAIVLASELGLFNRILDTANLQLEQWGIAILVSLLVLALCEGKKLLKIETETPAVKAVTTSPVAPQPAV